jgi:hypothetical protein
MRPDSSLCSLLNIMPTLPQTTAVCRRNVPRTPSFEGLFQGFGSFSVADLRGRRIQTASVNFRRRTWWPVWNRTRGGGGAPVIAVSNGCNVPIGGKGIQDAIFRRVESFVGIYSGRTDDDSLGIQIGIVWKTRVIDEILRGKMRGSNPLVP